MRSILASLVALVILGTQIVAAAELSGSGVILDDASKTETVNVGGLVVVSVQTPVIQNPPEVTVEAEGYTSLGKVKVAGKIKGKRIVGAVETWYLFTPTAAGETTIKVKVGKKTRTHKVTVEEAAEETKAEEKEEKKAE